MRRVGGAVILLALCVVAVLTIAGRGDGTQAMTALVTPQSAAQAEADTSDGSYPADRVSLPEESADPQAPRPPKAARWRAGFAESQDYLDLVQNVTAEALAGDPHAQYMIFLALNECESIRVPISQGITAASSRAKRGLTTGLEAFERREKLCTRLVKTEPFAYMPKRAAGYGAVAWLGMAVEKELPIAIATQAMLDVPGMKLRGDTKEADRTVTRVLESAIRAKDPDALAVAGELLMMSEDTEMLGAALQILACEVGFNCTDVAPWGNMSRCEDRDCPEGRTFQSELARRIGENEYERAGFMAARLRANWIAASSEGIMALADQQ